MAGIPAVPALSFIQHKFTTGINFLPFSGVYHSGWKQPVANTIITTQCCGNMSPGSPAVLSRLLKMTKAVFACIQMRPLLFFSAQGRIIHNHLNMLCANRVSRHKKRPPGNIMYISPRRSSRQMLSFQIIRYYRLIALTEYFIITGSRIFPPAGEFFSEG